MQSVEENPSETHDGYKGPLDLLIKDLPELRAECAAIQKALRGDEPGVVLDDHNYRVGKEYDRDKVSGVIIVISGYDLSIIPEDKVETRRGPIEINVRGVRRNHKTHLYEPIEMKLSVGHVSNEWKTSWITGHDYDYPQTCKNRYYVDKDGRAHKTSVAQGYNIDHFDRDILYEGELLIQCPHGWYNPTEINVFLPFDKFMSVDFSAL